MGINSTEVAYGFGQLGSAYCDAASAVTPPPGKVIIAVYFIQDNTPTALVSEDPAMFFNTVQTAHEQAHAHTNTSDHGDGGLALSGAKFKGGSTIFGRWTSITPAADDDGGIICYFGE
tara:strand:- start:1077 stop:1430 length:354 start_codon:yes stop_codon:yes gene_type:complete